jgi:hypothetical protein
MTEIKELIKYTMLVTNLAYQGSDVPKVVEKYHNGNNKFVLPTCKQGIHGTCKHWYEDGTLKLEEVFREGRLHGIRKEYYPSGKIKLQERYEDGQLFGTRVHWDEKGKITGKQLYIRGRFISGQLHEIINSREITAQDIIEIDDREARIVCLEEMGYEKFISQTERYTLDEEKDCELMRIDWHKEEEPLYFVRVKCPSVGVYYTLRVPPYKKTVKEALGWTFMLPEDRYNPKIET